MNVSYVIIDGELLRGGGSYNQRFTVSYYFRCLICFKQYRHFIYTHTHTHKGCGKVLFLSRIYLSISDSSARIGDR